MWITSATPANLPDWTTETASSGEEGISKLREGSFDAVVIQPPVAESTPEDLIEEVARAQAGTPILVLDNSASTQDVVRYMRLGAHDVAGADADLTMLLESAREFGGARRDGTAEEEPWRKFLVGTSRAMLRTKEIIQLVASRRATVLITGETGTGKEMVARAIHMASPRSQSPMVAVNCNALPENLLEAELFGHVKGAFTGAIQHRIGRFEQANRGTLFLDEIGDLPMEIQTKLLRVLQEREFQRVGSSETVRVDVRLIAATNLNLPQSIQEGKFRQDLYYRLNVVPISTPPLRDRVEDIPALVNHFVAKICHMEDIPLRRFGPEMLTRLASYPWPGNVRQLENEVEKAIALSGDREVLYTSDFPIPSDSLPTKMPAGQAISLTDAGLDFERTVSGIEREILVQALQKAGGNKTAAAGMLGLKRTTLAAKLKSLEAGAS